jgi:hypothetical protein
MKILSAYVLFLMSVAAQLCGQVAPTESHTPQSTANQQIPDQTTQPTSTAKMGKPVLEDGTPVKLRLTRNVSSADARVGETVDFEVLEEIRVGDLLVIPKGGVAWG